MTYLYAACSTVASVLGGVFYLYRRYKKSRTSIGGTFTGYVVGNVKLRLGSAFSKVLASQLSARRYAELALVRTSTKLMIPSVQNFQLNIDNVYVQLSLVTSGQVSVADRSLLDLNLPGEVNSVLVFGEPGSGKSTLTKKLFRDSCDFLRDNPNLFPLPVYLELRSVDWAGQPKSEMSQAHWFERKISDEIDAIRGVYSDGFIYRAFVANQGLVVLLDGLDEVPSEQLSLACEILSEGMRAIASYGALHTTIMVTGRSQLRTTLSRPFLSSFNEVATVAPFSPADVFEFLARWPFSSNSRSEAARIFRAIQSSSSLLEMCTNPLVLSMYVARDQLYVSRSGARPVRMPDTRADFYQEIIGELLLFRRGEQVATAVVGSQLRRQREDLLGRVALAHLLDRDQPANSIPWNLMVDTMMEIFQLSDVGQAEGEVRRLAIETGIFSEERRAETIRFLHLTLCEFLAAVELRESSPKKLRTLVRSIARPVVSGRRDGGRLLEVIIFSAALVGRATRDEIIETLLDADEEFTLLIPILRILYENHSVSVGMLDAVRNRVLAALRANYADFEATLRPLFLCVKILCHHPASIDYSRYVFDVISRLVDEDRVVDFARIVDVYLTVDTVAAIEEARRRGVVDLIGPQRLVRALEDPEVIEAAIQAFMVDPAFWAVPLAEAALSHKLVAGLLLETIAPRLGGPQHAESWVDNSVVAGSLYGEVLDFACQQVTADVWGWQAWKCAMVCHYEHVIRRDEVGILYILNILARMKRKGSPQPVESQIVRIRNGTRVDCWTRLPPTGPDPAARYDAASGEFDALDGTFFTSTASSTRISSFVEYMIDTDGPFVLLSSESAGRWWSRNRA